MLRVRHRSSNLNELILTLKPVLKDEMESAMKLIGVKDLSEVHPGLVNTSDVDHLVPSTPDHPYAKWRPRPRL